MTPLGFLGQRRVLAIALASSSPALGGCGDTTEPPAAPVLSFASPNAAMVGSSTQVTLTGARFSTEGGAVVHFEGGGLTATQVTVVNGHQITMLLASTPATLSGVRQISVETSAGTSGGIPFTLTRDPAPASILVVSGGATTDTVRTNLSAPLVVEVRDAEGFPLPGTSVRFTRAAPNFGVPYVGVLPVGGAGFEEALQTVTDAQGRAMASVRFGHLTGTDRVRFQAGAARDSVTYAMTPGNAASVRIVGADTAMTLGSTAGFTARTYDIQQNQRADVPTLSVTPGSLSIDGTDVTATTFGQGLLIAAHGELKDTVLVAVVPPGQLLVLGPLGDTHSLVSMNTDLSQRRSYLASGAAGGRWLATGDRVVLHAPNGGESRLYRSDGGSVPARVISQSIPIISEEWPSPSTDGEWIYFLGRPDHQSYGIWRVRADGTDPEQITAPASAFDQDLHASASPSGDSIVYWTSRSPFGLVVRELESGDIVSLGHPESRFSRWSPRGDWIAFHDAGQLRLVRPDASDDHLIGSAGGGYQGHISWSADGVWLVVRRFDALELVNVDTGLRIELPRTSQLEQPSWRPASP